MEKEGEEDESVIKRRGKKMEDKGRMEEGEKREMG